MGGPPKKMLFSFQEGAQWFKRKGEYGATRVHEKKREKERGRFTVLEIFDLSHFYKNNIRAISRCNRTHIEPRF